MSLKWMMSYKMLECYVAGLSCLYLSYGMGIHDESVPRLLCVQFLVRSYMLLIE